MAGFKNISIKNKLILMQVLTAIVALIICSVMFVLNHIKTFKDTEVKNTNSIAEIVGVNAAAPLLFNDQESAMNLLLNLKSNSSILNASILDKTGKEFAHFSQKGSESFIFPKAYLTSDETKKVERDDYVVRYKIYQDKEFLGTVQLHAEIIDLRIIITNYLKIAGLVLLSGILAAYFISIFLHRLITTRLYSMIFNTKKVTETGDYSIRISTEGNDELAVLSKEFNNMMAQIENMQTTLKEINIGLEQRVQDRTKELEQFAYVASHDLQEPLRTISNFVGLLEKRISKKTDVEADQYLSFIINATSKMQNLIKDLLEFSRTGKGITFETVNCNEVIGEVTIEMAASISESAAKIKYPHLPTIIGNKTELKRLFQNLLSNAIKFRREGIPPQIEITVKETNLEYLFSIKDNGIGIDEQYKDKLFVMFQRLNSTDEYPGTGIGLATCKKIVLLHSGKIWFESKLGEGSTFYFTISKKLEKTKEEKAIAFDPATGKVASTAFDPAPSQESSEKTEINLNK